jgi:hypothetical protein
MLNFTQKTDINGINIKFLNDSQIQNTVFNVVNQSLVELFNELDYNYGVDYVKIYQSLIDYDNPTSNPIPTKAFEVKVVDRLQELGIFNVSAGFGEVFNHSIKMNFTINTNEGVKNVTI